jgi:hypothetical protein
MGAFCNVQFTETATDPQVRIGRDAGDGYWSYLGTDVLHIAAGERTMNLDSFTMNTADSEFYRVIRHEPAIRSTSRTSTCVTRLSNESTRRKHSHISSALRAGRPNR